MLVRPVSSPDHVKNDPPVFRIRGMSVGDPAGGVEVNLDVAFPGSVLPESDKSPAEIGTGFPIQKPGVQNLNRPGVLGDQCASVDALMFPHPLQQSFRRRFNRLP